MSGEGMLRGGAALLWRRQRVLWWVFAVNLAAGLLASWPVRSQLSPLNSSVEARDSLYHQMNVFRLQEVLMRPDMNPRVLLGNSVALGVVFVLVLLFAIGGVLEALYMDRVLRFGDFLRSSARYFWRMVRLTIVFVVFMLPLMAAQSGLDPLSDWMGNRWSSEQLQFWVRFACMTALALLALAIRVWVDVAQLDCVAHERAAVRHSLARARSLLRGTFLRVWGSVLGIQLLVAIVTIVLLWIWTKLPPEAIGRTFLIGEIIVLLWIGARLWQKAAETVWYHAREASDAHNLAALEVRNQPSALVVQDSAPAITPDAT